MSTSRGSRAALSAVKIVASSTARATPSAVRPRVTTSTAGPDLSMGAVGQVRHYNPFNNLNLPAFFRRRDKNKGENRTDQTETSASEGSSSSSSASTPASTSTSDALLRSAQDATAGVANEDVQRELMEQMERDGEVVAESKMPRGTAEKGKWKEHKYSTAKFKISDRKLNKLANQIAKLPVDEAILQMQFSDKRASNRIKSTLALARNHAVDKGLDSSRLIVAESWVSKGVTIKRLDIKGRGRMGIKEHRQARLHVVLREGKTRQEQFEEKRQKTLAKIRSAGVVPENPAWRNAPIYGWRW